MTPLLQKSDWRWLATPSARYSLGGIAAIGFVGGVLFWGGFNTALELSNTKTFCISCHVPKQWHHKLHNGQFATFS